MASSAKSGASRRKAAPGKLRIVMKGLTSKSKPTAGSDVEDEVMSEDMEEESHNGIPDDLPEGTVVVQPEAVEDEAPKKKKEAPVRIDTSVLDNVSCTACGRQLNPYKSSALQKHPQLKVIICRRCSKFLCSGEIAKDKDGVDEQCRWCGEGGRLVVCDHCSSAFCKACVMRNFNRSEFNNINGQTSWKCYICDKAPLQGLRENYRNVRDTLKALQAKEKAKANKDSTSPTSNGTKASESSDVSASMSSSSAKQQQQGSSNKVPEPSRKFSSTSQNTSLSQKNSTVDGRAGSDSGGVKKTMVNDDLLTILASDLKVEPETVDVLMDKLSTATDTFKGTLRALRAQFHPVSPGDEEEGGQQLRFTLSSRMNIFEKKERCAKALNSTLQTYVKSLKVILSGTSTVKATPTLVPGGDKVPSTSSVSSSNDREKSVAASLSSIPVNGAEKTTTRTTSNSVSTTRSSLNSGGKSTPTNSTLQSPSKSSHGKEKSTIQTTSKSLSASSKSGEKSSTNSTSSQLSNTKSTTKISAVKTGTLNEKQQDSSSSDANTEVEKESSEVHKETSKSSSESKKINGNSKKASTSSAERFGKETGSSAPEKSSKENSLCPQRVSKRSNKGKSSAQEDLSSEDADIVENEDTETVEDTSHIEDQVNEKEEDMETNKKGKSKETESVPEPSAKKLEKGGKKSTDVSDNAEKETVSQTSQEKLAKKSEKKGKESEDDLNNHEKRSESSKISSSNQNKDKTKTVITDSSQSDGASLAHDNHSESQSMEKGKTNSGDNKDKSDEKHKDPKVVKGRETSVNEDENMAAKFDLIKELAEEMLKDRSEEENGEDSNEEDKDESEEENKGEESEEENKDEESEEENNDEEGEEENKDEESEGKNKDEEIDRNKDGNKKDTGKDRFGSIDIEDNLSEASNVESIDNDDVSRICRKRNKPDIISSSDEEQQPRKSTKTAQKGLKVQEDSDNQKKAEAKSEASDASSSDILMSSDEDDSDVVVRRRQGSKRSARKDKAPKEKPVAVPKAKEKAAPAKESKTTNQVAKKGKDNAPAGAKKSEAVDKKESTASRKGKDSVTIKGAGKSSASKSKINGKKDSDDDEDDTDKEIDKLSKMPVRGKRKTTKDSEEEVDEVEEEEKKKEKEKAEAAKTTKTKRSKPGPKSSKKPEDFEDLSSDENEEKVDSDDEYDDDDDLPQVTFCLDNVAGEEELDENEQAKNGLLEEIDNDKDSSNDEDDEDDSDKSSDDDDTDSPKTKKKTAKGKKGVATKKKEEERDDEDDEDDGDDSDDGVGKRKSNRKASKLLNTKLSDSDSDVGTSSKKTKKKKEDDEDFKEDNDEKSSGSSIESDLDDEDDDDDKDDSENLSGDDSGETKKKKKGKKKRKGKKKKKGKKKGKKGAKEGEDEEEEKDEEDEDEDDESGEKKKGKGKKRKRIKKMANSSDEDGEKDSDDDDDDEDGKKNTPGHRRKIRKVMSNKKLEDSTRAAAKAEEKRRKRISAKQREFNIETITDENNPMNCPITTKLVLEPGKEEGDEPVIQVNKKLVRKLKPHQVEAAQFMWDCMYESVKRSKKETGAGCILAHCMGLGKTLSVITFVHTILTHEKQLGHRTALVVCPLNTVLNWQSEWTQWLDEEDQLDVWELASCKQNPARADMLKEWKEEGGIMILGYEMYRNLTTGARIKNKRQKKIFQETLVDPGPDLVICDEGHILKNEASAISKAMNQMKTRRRVVLTGTPLQNNLNEYHCMVSFVKPNLLGTRKEFNNRFISPIQNGQCTDSTARDVKLMKARAHVLHEMLAGCVQRRDYSALTKFLPPKQEYVMSVRLTDVQIDLYNRYLELSGQGVDGVFNNKGARLFKDYQNLMKIWTHPWVLKMAEIRDELKMKYDDEDSFIDDESMDERSFSSSESSSEEKFNSDSGGEGTSSGQKRGTRRTRCKARRLAGEDSDPEEVIAEWKSKTRGQNDEKPMEIEPDKTSAITNDWWAEFVKEDDKAIVELSNKLFLLFEILRMCEEIGDKVLIFSQSILSLNIIENFLETVDSKFQQEAEELEEEEAFGKSWTKNLDYYRMDGSTSAQNRQAWAKSFNDLDNYRARLFLISTKAGGLGINLVAANRVIIFDASWNPSHDVQSIFRVYRFGQTKPCYIYRFLAQGTMEEKIYERQVTKLSLSQRVVDEHQIERHFSASDLKELYTFRPDRWGDGTDKPTLALPKDPLLAEILTNNKHTVQSFHEHDSLLENQIEQTLTEEEKKAAWEEYENEKKGIIIRGPGMERTNASWPMMAAAQILSREQITATVQALRQQLPDVSEDLFQLHVQQALRRMVQLKQEEMRRIEMLRMQEMNYINMMKQEAQGMSHAQSMAAMQGMQSNMAPWLQIQRLRAMQAQMLQGMGAGSSGMMNPAAMMGMASSNMHPQRISNKPEDAIDLDASPTK